jgi:hypothetical protein
VQQGLLGPTLVQVRFPPRVCKAPTSSGALFRLVVAFSMVATNKVSSALSGQVDIFYLLRCTGDLLWTNRPRWALSGPDLHRLIAPALLGAFPLFDDLVGTAVGSIRRHPAAVSGAETV